MALTQQPSKRAPPSPTTLAAVLALLAALVVLPLALAPRAGAFIYYSNTNSIGRANLNGTGLETGFIKQHVGAPLLIAINDRHIYWTYDSGMDTIGRAKLDGTGVDPGFFRPPGACYQYRPAGAAPSDRRGRRPPPPPSGCAPIYLAVDSDHIYWTTLRGDPPIGGIGRSKLDGTGVDADFISGISPGGLAVDRDHIYWLDSPPPGPGSDASITTTIGRANLDGTAVDDSFISGLDGVGDVAVGHDHIYWTAQQEGGSKHTIGRARIDGTGANESFITGAGEPYGVAVDAKHVYWTSERTSTLRRANLDGTDVRRAFIYGIGGSEDIAVDSLGPLGKATAKPTQGQKGKRIVLKVKVKARERLTASASGEIKVNPTYKLRPKKVRLAARQTKTLKLKPRKAKATKIAAALKRGEKATAKLEVKLTDEAGNTKTEKLRVRLKGQ